MSRLVRRFGSRQVYLSSMVSFTASTLVICLSKSVVLVTLMSALTGYAYATLQTLPYTLTCYYHKEKEVGATHTLTLEMCLQNVLLTQHLNVCLVFHTLGLYAIKEKQKWA